uniref:Uncharacterized protein n=1 Tax=Peronospora matthiolae TaxID=2874970 RepID=A0AAV1UU45_9STRA
MLFCFYLLALALVVSISSGSLSVPPTNNSTKLPAQNMDTSMRSETDGKRMPIVTDVSNESAFEERWWPEADAIVGTVKAYLKQLIQPVQVKGPLRPVLREVSMVPTARIIPTERDMGLQDPVHLDPDDKFQQASKMVTARKTHLDLAHANVDTSTYAQVLRAHANVKESPERDDAITKAEADVAEYAKFKILYELQKWQAEVASHEKPVDENQAPHLPSL